MNKKTNNDKIKLAISALKVNQIDAAINQVLGINFNTIEPKLIKDFYLYLSIWQINLEKECLKYEKTGV